MTHYRSPDQFKGEFRAHPRRALILTTVVHESKAVRAHMSKVERLAHASGHFYDVGTFEEPAGDWLVVHAITQPGNSDAGLVVAAAHSDFGPFDALLFVGVGGSLKSSVPLGSVVAGERVYNAESAKVENGRYLSRPHGHQAATELVSAAKMLELDGDWIDLIKPPIGMTLPKTDEYPCPYPPLLAVKGIASGEKVVAGEDTEAYRAMRSSLQDAAVVEMEGWGATNAAHRAKTSAKRSLTCRFEWPP